MSVSKSLRMVVLIGLVLSAVFVTGSALAAGNQASATSPLDPQSCVVYRITLDGSQEVPPNSSTATGGESTSAIEPPHILQALLVHYNPARTEN